MHGDLRIFDIGKEKHNNLSKDRVQVTETKASFSSSLTPRLDVGSGKLLQESEFR